jgi:uncharacterized protein (DUF1778 family)
MTLGLHRPNRTMHRETLNFRVKAEDRSLIDRAAQLLGKIRTEFMLESARRAAQDALLDQTLFQGKPESLRGVCRASRCAARAEREAAPDDDDPGALEIDGAHGSAARSTKATRPAHSIQAGPRSTSG